MKTFKTMLSESLITPDESLTARLNDQMNEEFGNAFAYLQIAAFFESKSLEGFATWARGAAEHENSHGMKFFNYLVDVNAYPTIQAIPAPLRESFTNAEDAIREALMKEESTTAKMYQLCSLAEGTGNKATSIFLQDFVTEQVEEEKKVKVLLDKLVAMGSDSGALLALDRELKEGMYF
jgi:ferritin